MQLREYQAACKRTIDALEGGSHLVQMATGLGKTFTFASLDRRGERVLLLSHRDELVRQPRKYYDCSFGVEQAGERSHGETVVSASVQSLVRRLDAFHPEDFGMIITDEAHHAAAKTYKQIYAYFKPRIHIGFTATPNRGDSVRLDDVFSDIVFRRDLRWGIQNGYLCDIHCLRAEIGYDISGVATRMGDYAPKQLAEAMDRASLNDAVAEAYRKYAKGATLIFASSVHCAEEIAKRIDGAVAVTAETKNRSEIIERFTKREIPCLVNCMIFTEGTDLPLVETIILARPTQNDALYSQMVGRGLRLHPEKDKLILIDCCGVTGKADLCTAPSLLGLSLDGVPDEQKPRIEGDLFDLPDLVARHSDSPQSWIQNIRLVDLWAKKQGYNTHDLNFFKMPNGSLVLSLPQRKRFVLPAPDMLGNTTFCGATLPMQEAIDRLYRHLCACEQESVQLWDLRKAKRWGRAPATGKQKQFIRRRKVPIDPESLTKLEAMQIIHRITCG